MSSIGLQLIASAIDSQDVSEFVEFSLKADLFTKTELSAFEYVNQFVYKHGKIPERETFLSEVNEIDVLPTAKEPPSYYYEEIKKRHVHKTLTSGMLESKNILLEEKNPEKALDVLTESCITLQTRKNANQMIDFREAKDTLLKSYKTKQKNPELSGIKLGWPTLDEMSGGLLGGDLISYIGRPASGKTFMMLYSALNMWDKQNKKVMFVSMEMLPSMLINRLASIYASVKLTHLNKAQLGSDSLKRLVSSMYEVSTKEHPFWIMDGNLTASVEDIWVNAKMLKPDVIIVDGAYLLGHPNNRLNRFERVADNCRMLKNSIATDLRIPVLTSWQFNREATKKAKKGGGDQGDLEDIGFSDEIGQLSSLVLGLYQKESVETINSREIKILKGRSGETGKFSVNWDFYKMNFDEVNMNKNDPMKYE